jgi:hypothetical protein
VPRCYDWGQEARSIGTRRASFWMGSRPRSRFFVMRGMKNGGAFHRRASRCPVRGRTFKSLRGADKPFWKFVYAACPRDKRKSIHDQEVKRLSRPLVAVDNVVPPLCRRAARPLDTLKLDHGFLKVLHPGEQILRVRAVLPRLGAIVMVVLHLVGCLREEPLRLFDHRLPANDSGYPLGAGDYRRSDD